ncbi:MAG: transcription-repair coupling factor [Acidobacteriota bacterium]
MTPARTPFEAALGIPALDALSRGAPGAPLALTGLHGSARALYAVGLARRMGRSLLFVARRQEEIPEMEAALRFFASVLGFCSDENVLALPGYEVDPLLSVSPHPDVLDLRVRAFTALSGDPPFCIVTTPLGLAAGGPPRGAVGARLLALAEGQAVSREEILGALHDLGYRKEWRVEAPGEYALRGGIIDVFPAGSRDPLRIELDGDAVGSLREFAVATQRSLAVLPSVKLAPAREQARDGGWLSRATAAILARGEATSREDDAVRLAALLEARGTFPGVELWSSAIDGRTPLHAHVTGAPPVTIWDEAEASRAAYDEARRDLGDRMASEAPFLPALDDLMPLLGTLDAEALVGPVIHASEIGRIDDGPGAAHVPSRPAPAYGAKLGDLCRDLKTRRARGEEVVVFLSSIGTRRRLAEVIEDYHVMEVEGSGSVLLEIGALAGGFELPQARLTVLTEEEVFGSVLVRTRKGERPAPSGKPARRPGFAPVADFQDLEVGDYVVHVENGIGRYQGLAAIGAGPDAREFMLLLYQDGDKLYVPLDRLDLVQRYKGTEEAAPRLDKLGGGTWEKTKRRVKKAVREIGEELLKLYARRAAATGFAFSPDTPWQRELEDSFPYDETPDQLQAIEDVRRDMEGRRPMDRVLCGDVGYGKTEVAMRAAFKACNDGKQVALLCPTTVLAAQHLRTFRQRFLPFPVTIEMMSRFVPKPDQTRIAADLAAGKVDVLIGTHRILGKDVVWKELGLIVIDEEQRFGVAHKEKLKELRAHVDVLTMTATPIPRTLQMAIAGIRDLSVIETPPRHRLSVQTTVQQYREETIREAVRRELSRGGQCYFVHDRVESIDSIAAMVQRLVPEARIVVGHGQMPEKLIEKVMLRFVSGEADVLVATTIIENGLDIPAANTLIVNRADRFGLAQLYQLRGRVGRADRRAYAFFLVPSPAGLTDVARKRLAAIEEFSELGAGYRVAALDMEIRGSGNLLGAEQHGHIESVGFDLYARLLDEAVRELKGEEVAPDIRVALNLKVDIRIPPEFLPDVAERMTLYKRIAHAADDDAIEAIASEVRDLYGRLPIQVERLLGLTRVRNLATGLRVESLERTADRLSLRFHESTPLRPESLVELLGSRPGAELKDNRTVEVPLTLSEREDAVAAARGLLLSLS